MKSLSRILSTSNGYFILLVTSDRPAQPRTVRSPLLYQVPNISAATPVKGGVIAIYFHSLPLKIRLFRSNG